MEVDLALLADAATIDGSGKLNILGIFDRIGTGSFPARHPRMVLILRFSATLNETGRHDIGISLKAPDGAELVRVDGEMQLGPGPGGVPGMIRVPHVLNLDGLVFPKPGPYAFDVWVDGEHHVSLPLTVYGPETTAEA
jgi:hypothetical protein|tara:strand:- start:79 stop:492 length:414 start_codon:yes stop_codon:yes gene_type:complete